MLPEIERRETKEKNGNEIKWFSPVVMITEARITGQEGRGME